MAAHRFFLTEPLGADAAAGPVTLPLSVSDLHHAVKVARIRVGERIVVVEPSGRALGAEVVEVARDAVTASIGEVLAAVVLPDVTLFLGLPKGGKADTVIEKATEVGVARIVPVVTERSISRPDDDAGRRVERWRRIAAAAAAQSQRDRIPQVEAPVPMDEVVAAVAGFDRFLVAWEESSAPGIGASLAGVADAAVVAVLVGPEGGLTAPEVERLAAAGAVTVSLGPTILRSETAGIIAVALASAALGGLGERDA